MDVDLYLRDLAASLVAPQAVSYQPRRSPQNRIWLPCGGCGRRIASWTAEIRPGWLGLQDVSYRGWKWQGEDDRPVSFRGELVDVTCCRPPCGWSRAGIARQTLPSWWLAPPEILS